MVKLESHSYAEFIRASRVTFAVAHIRSYLTYIDGPTTKANRAQGGRCVGIKGCVRNMRT
jgi:hypothetical protein